MVSIKADLKLMRGLTGHAAAPSQSLSGVGEIIMLYNSYFYTK